MSKYTHTLFFNPSANLVSENGAFNFHFFLSINFLIKLYYTPWGAAMITSWLSFCCVGCTFFSNCPVGSSWLPLTPGMSSWDGVTRSPLSPSLLSSPLSDPGWQPPWFMMLHCTSASWWESQAATLGPLVHKTWVLARPSEPPPLLASLVSGNSSAQCISWWM